jgi:hypothetical protein
LQAYVSRYQRGEGAAVWSDLVALGTRVRLPEYVEEARAVARETMWRVRHNLEEIHRRLNDIGYEFAHPHQALLPPAENAVMLLDSIEERIGPMPLSLRAFYEVVGAVNFTQSAQQLYHTSWRGQPSPPELTLLGFEDPLEVAPIDRLIQAMQVQSGVQRNAVQPSVYWFADDETHKAHRSGGENYHVWLPNAAADFVIEGMFEFREYFVANLRESCRWAGFRGTLQPWYDGAHGSSIKVPPHFHLIATLSEALEPI